MDKRTNDIACVAYFLAGARKQNEMHNSHTAQEAFSAFCRLMDIDEAKALLKIDIFSR